MSCFIVFFGLANGLCLILIRNAYKKGKDVWLFALFLLFISFMVNVFFHESVALLGESYKEYLKYLSDTLVEPMIILWSVILGAVFFSKNNQETKSQHRYDVRVIEKHDKV